MLFTEPVPIAEGDPQAAFYYNAYLRDLFQKAQYLRLTQRSGAPANHDKAGNLNAKWAVFTSNASANTEDTVAHKLGRVPLGWLAAIPDKAANIYLGTTAWTTTDIYVKTSVATVAWKLILF